MSRFLHIFGGVVLIGATALVWGETRQVPSEFATIQEAINASRDGDTVDVLPGIYFENINFGLRAIILRSMAGADQTIIDGGGLGPVVFIEKGDRNTGVFGFTIQNGRNQYGAGGIQVERAAPTLSGNIVQYNLGTHGKGISLHYAAALVSNNIIRSNRISPGISGGGGGGGIGVVFSSCTGSVCRNEIDQNLIEMNSASGFLDGGAIYGFSPGELIITNNIMRENEAAQKGGAIALNNSYNVRIENNLFIENVAGFNPSYGIGGAIHLGGSSPGSRIINNTFVSNRASQASTIMLGFLDKFVNNIIINDVGAIAVKCFQSGGTNANTIRNNIISGAAASAFSPECSVIFNTFGNINSSPEFFPGTYFLKPGSYGIDDGDRTYSLLLRDAAGANRVVDGDFDGLAQIDVGAFEHQGGFANGFEENLNPGHR